MLLVLALALSTTANDPVTTDKPKKEKKICRAGESTGSRIAPPQVCKTAAEWEADAELTRRTMQSRERRTGM